MVIQLLLMTRRVGEISEWFVPWYIILTYGGYVFLCSIDTQQWF